VASANVIREVEALVDDAIQGYAVLRKRRRRKGGRYRNANNCFIQFVILNI
jgi:hypothetical protein